MYKVDCLEKIISSNPPERRPRWFEEIPMKTMNRCALCGWSVPFCASWPPGPFSMIAADTGWLSYSAPLLVWCAWSVWSLLRGWLDWGSGFCFLLGRCSARTSITPNPGLIRAWSWSSFVCANFRLRASLRFWSAPPPRRQRFDRMFFAMD